MIKIRKILNNCINISSDLSQVINVLNKSDEKICIILNQNRKIIGIYNDGDLRRALVKKNSLSNKAHFYCNKKFIHISNSKLDEENIKKLFKKYKYIQHLPVLDSKQKFLGIINKYDFYEKKKYENEILILAGGLGERLRPLTNFLPKPMLTFGGKPLLESQIYLLKHFGFNNINISVNYMAKKITDYFGNGENYGVNIKYLQETNKLGTAGPLYFLKNKKLNLPILVLNGDIYTSLNFKELLFFHKKKKFDITLCTNVFETQIPYGVLNLNNKDKNLIKEKPIVKFEINSGIYIIEPKLLKYIKKKFINMNDFINDAKKRNYKIGKFKMYEPIIDIGNFQSYEYAKQFLKNV